MTFIVENHTLHIDEETLGQILVPAARKFDETVKFEISSLPQFQGAGIYSIYIDADADTIYKGKLNSDYPIYVGKAVRSGSRQGRSTNSGSQLRTRLRQHGKSIEQGGLPIDKIRCRFLVMSGVGEDLISALETALIRKYLPLWNSHIDGFGIHTPGAGRYNQRPSEWDTLHGGRPWLEKLTGEPRDAEIIKKKVVDYQMRKNI